MPALLGEFGDRLGGPPPHRHCTTFNQSIALNFVDTYPHERVVTDFVTILGDCPTYQISGLADHLRRRGSPRKTKRQTTYEPQ
jgi:hypothetical protein